MAAMTKRRICLNLALLLFLCLFFFPTSAAADTSSLIIDGTVYTHTASHSGEGWTYSYSSGMGYLYLQDYTGGPIYAPCSISVEYYGVNIVTASKGENALYCQGDVLTLGSSDPEAVITLTGGSGAAAIFGRSVSLWGWGRLFAFAGSGSPAVWGEDAALITMEQMVLMGSNQMAIATDLGGIIRVSGAHKYYAGENEDTAVESVFYSGEFYLRAEAAKALITFDAAGGTVKGEKTYTVSLTVTTSGTNLTTYLPQRKNYTFLGWNSEPDGSGSQPPPRLYSGGELTYYAIWERVSSLIPIPDEMLAQPNAFICAAIYYGSGQLWDVLILEGDLSAFTIPELPEDGMTYTVFCADATSFVPLTPSESGDL